MWCRTASCCERGSSASSCPQHRLMPACGHTCVENRGLLLLLLLCPAFCWEEVQRGAPAAGNGCDGCAASPTAAGAVAGAGAGAVDARACSDAQGVRLLARGGAGTVAEGASIAWRASNRTCMGVSERPCTWSGTRYGHGYPPSIHATAKQCVWFTVLHSWTPCPSKDN